MRRRTLLAGLGSLVASGSLAVGTGAFSTTRAERTVSVSVADDASAVLKLEQIGTGGRSIPSGSKVTFSFPGAFASDDLGLGTDSVYEFDTDSGRSVFGDTNEDEQKLGLLLIKNQGTQKVSVFARDESESAVDIEMYDFDGGKTALRKDPATLAPGGEVKVGFRVRTHGAVSGKFKEKLTVVAQATE